MRTLPPTPSTPAELESQRRDRLERLLQEQRRQQGIPDAREASWAPPGLVGSRR